MISVQNVQFERHFLPVFQPVSFAVGAGGLLLVTGPNGCGKTTLIRLLAGVLRPSAGTLDRAAGSAAYVGHQLAVKDDLSVRENLEFTRRMLGGAGDPEEAMQRMGLGRVGDQLGRSLSAGQRKRCALARLLLDDARLWLLDEPYTNLDREGLELVDELLCAQLDGGGACIMSTHGSLRPRGTELAECALQAGGTPG